MTDDDMDARLRTAGTAWRTRTDDPTPGIVEPLSPEEALPFGRPARERRRHRTAWLASAAAVAAVLVAGGGFLLGRVGTDHGHRTTAADSASLENTTWQLLGYDGDQLRKNSFATFALRDGGFVADDSCGLYNGTARVDGDHLRLADVETRFYNCTDSVGEVTFDHGLKTLQGDPSWSIDGDRLTISGAGPTLHLAAAPNLPAPTSDRPTLTGATWQLTKVVDANGTAQPLHGTADFRIDGNHLHASDTCNTLDGTLQLDYPILKLDGLATTEIGCPQDSVAPIVDQVMSGNVRADFRDTTLTLTKDGAGTLTYRWQPEDEAATDPKRLAATDWELRSINGVPANGMTLSVTPTRLALSAGCASTDVPVELGPGTLFAPDLAKEPKNECPPERTDVEEMIATSPALWRIAGRQLIVNHAGSQGFALVFDAAKDVSAASVELPGTWKLTGVERNDGNSDSGSGSSSGSSITLTFKDGRFSATTCTAMQGTVVFAENTIELGDIALAAGPVCPAHLWGNDEVMQVLNGGTVRWSVANGQLKLTKGTVTLTFER